MAQDETKDLPKTSKEYLEKVKSNSPEVTWEKGEPQTLTQANLEKFIRGELTWAQVTGVSMEQAYGMAELGYNLFNQGKLNEAKTIFDGLVLMNPYDGYFHAMVGAILARQKKPDEALKSLNIAAGLEPKDPQVFANRAEIHLNAGRFEEALADLRQAIDIDPEGNNPAVVRARALAGATAQLIEQIVQNKLAAGGQAPKQPTKAAPAQAKPKK